MSSHLPAFLVVAFITLFSPAQGAMLNDSERAAIEAAVAAYQKASGAPGVSVYIDQGGQPGYTQTFGIADLEHNVPVTPETVFPIGSITKSFTALAVLQLVAAGRVDLEQPIGHYLTDYQGPGSRARIRELLNHTSGIPNYTNEVPGVGARLKRAATDRAQMLATFAAAPLLFEPGTAWSYSNSNYYLLGLLIEKVSGEDYYAYVKEHIAKPLGLRSIASGDDREIVPNRARGYQPGRAGLENATPWHYLVPFSAGSLLATAADIARYRRAVLRAEGIDPKVRDLVLTSHALADGTPNNYLYGALIRSDFGGVTKLAHSGEIWGFESSHAYYPERNVTIAVLTNSKIDLLSAVSLERKIARIVLRLPEPPPPVKPDAKDLVRVAGVYAITPLHIVAPEFEFVVRDSALWLGFGRGSPVDTQIPLVSRGPGRYVLAMDDEWVFTFESKGKDGRAAKLDLDALNGHIFGKRVP